MFSIVLRQTFLGVAASIILLVARFQNITGEISHYSRLSLSRSRGDPLKHFEISVLRHIRFAELRKVPIEQPNFTNEHVI